jgi:hypothetical protein
MGTPNAKPIGLTYNQFKCTERFPLQMTATTIRQLYLPEKTPGLFGSQKRPGCIAVRINLWRIALVRMVSIDMLCIAPTTPYQILRRISDWISAMPIRRIEVIYRWL